LKKIKKIADALWFLVPVILVTMGNVVSKDLTCSDVSVKLRGAELNEFLEEKELIEEVNHFLGYPLKGKKLIHNDLGKVENLLKSNKFVEDAKVVSDHKGRVVFDIKLEQPIARIITNDSSYYLTRNGNLMPVSHTYTARVMLILGSKINRILSKDSLVSAQERMLFVEMVNYIDKDPFLKAQVAVIEVNNASKLVLYPQVTDQKILFGTCENYVEKFKKLKVFYDQILPRKGWNAYKSVNLDYKNQIICE
jgi:cell division protein FtsQ